MKVLPGQNNQPRGVCAGPVGRAANPGGELKFAPGQLCPLGVESVERRWERPYSIVSSPYEEELEFFFELVPEGKLTPSLYKLQSGDELLMRKVPKGRFTLETKGERTNHLLVSP